MGRWLFLFGAALLCAGPLALADDPAPLVDELRAFFAEEDPGARALKGLRLASRDARDLAVAVEAAHTPQAEAPKGDVETWKRRTPDGVEHTIYASIPESYDRMRRWPVLIWLHGGVNRELDEGGIFGIRYLGETSDEEGFLLLSPSTQRGAEWWTPNGVALIRGALEDLKKRWHVDADAVAVSGFSDGASACFHLLTHDPEPYCCFLPLMAHPGVTRLMGGPCFHANVRSRPVMAFNGGKDGLYPSSRMKPMMDELKEAGCDITWTDLPEAEHRIPHVLPEHWPALRDFWKSHRRKAVPHELRWETALPESEGRFGWVEVLEVDPSAPSDPELEAGLFKDPAGRPRLGVQLDMEHRGEGLKLQSVQPGTAAAEAGFEAGDVIIAVDGQALGQGRAAFGVLSRALQKLTDRDGVFRMKRGDEEVELKARPRVVETSNLPRPAERGYGRPSGRIVSRVAGNEIHVRTRHVKRFRLHLASGLIDLGRPLRVVVNGKLRHDARVAPSAAHLLAEAVRGGPGAPLYVAQVVLTP